MVAADITSVFLRLAEIASASIVAGITGHFLHIYRNVAYSSLGRFVYTEVVAGLSILFGLILLIPFSASAITWPIDIILSICWFVSFGLLINLLHGSCIWWYTWNGIWVRRWNSCGLWRADEAFAFISAICWLVSALVGIHRWRNRRTAVAAGERRRWYRRTTV